MSTGTTAAAKTAGGKFSKFNAEELIRIARTKLICNHPWFGQLATRLILTECTNIKYRDPKTGEIKSQPMPTMATDGVRLFFNPTFVLAYANEPAKIQGLVAHETLHCAMGHPFRMPSLPGEHSIKKLIAADLAINPMCRDSGKSLRNPADRWEMPNEALYPAQWKLDEGLTMEQYFRLLPEMQEQQEGDGDGDGDGKGKGKGKPGEGQHGRCGGCLPAPGKNPDGEYDNTIQPTPGELGQMQSQWDILIDQATQSARTAGKLPAGMERMLEDVRAPRIDIEDVLRRFMIEKARNDYRMFPPNRRYASFGLYLPSIASQDNMGEMVVFIDTSGSVDARELNFFLSKLNSVLAELKPRICHVISGDTQVWSHIELTADDYPVTAAEAKRRKIGAGGGGTSFHPMFKFVEDNDINPACAVFLTDMYPNDGWPADPGYPVLWAATTTVVAPWGETVQVRSEG